MAEYTLAVLADVLSAIESGQKPDIDAEFAAGLMDVARAARYPLPENATRAFEQALNQNAPDGYTVRILQEGSRLRFLYALSGNESAVSSAVSSETL